MITTVLPQLMVRVETKGRCGEAVVVFVDIDGCCTSCDGCNNHAARRMVKSDNYKGSFVFSTSR